MRAVDDDVIVFGLDKAGETPSVKEQSAKCKVQVFRTLGG